MPYVNRGTIFVPRFRKFSNTEHNDAVRSMPKSWYDFRTTM